MSTYPCILHDDDLNFNGKELVKENPEIIDDNPFLLENGEVNGEYLMDVSKKVYNQIIYSHPNWKISLLDYCGFDKDEIMAHYYHEFIRRRFAYKYDSNKCTPYGYIKGGMRRNLIVTMRIVGVGRHAGDQVSFEEVEMSNVEDDLEEDSSCSYNQIEAVLKASSEDSVSKRFKEVEVEQMLASLPDTPYENCGNVHGLELSQQSVAFLLWEGLTQREIAEMFFRVSNYSVIALQRKIGNIVKKIRNFLIDEFDYSIELANPSVKKKLFTFFLTCFYYQRNGKNL